MRTKPNKPAALEDYLTREDFRARFEAEKAKAQRHYCTVLRFWRSCRFKPCRRERACRGDARECLQRSIDRVPRELKLQARQMMLSATPPNAAAPERAAREIMPDEHGAARDLSRSQSIPRGWTRTSARRSRRGAKR